MDIAHLKTMNKTIGAKQTLKNIAKGTVKYVFVGHDSDESVVEPIRNACEAQGIPVNDKHTMDDLGRACRIKVRATAVGPTLILVISDVTLCYDGSIINLKFGKEVPKCQQLIS